MRKRGRVVVVGSSNTDLITHGERLPRPGETVLHEKFFKAAGGKGANQAVAAARCGAEVVFLGAVGSDAFGREARAGLKAEGISVRFLVTRRDVPSGVALILVDRKGENMIAVAPGANAQLRPKHIRAARGELQRAKVVLASLGVPCRLCTKRSRSPGAPVP